MRTLKKTLSLVLVVAMVLGLCVVGASAYNKVEDFTDDVSKIGDAYYEAVGVLTGIGVIDGMTETAFEPQGTYTREQAAKIIAYMMLGKDKADSLGCTVAPFE
ncbi:MAG: S-layer homology domain-containing protein, partial [Oscillospiraceae bacterium]|nr:S-layer homology domain-containing protein [Oscillospiraceae bacterium]